MGRTPNPPTASSSNSYRVANGAYRPPADPIPINSEWVRLHSLTHSKLNKSNLIENLVTQMQSYIV